MIASLKQSDSREAALAGAIHNCLHQQSTNLAILITRFDRDWPKTGNWIALIQEICTDNATVNLSHEVVKSFMTDHVAEQASSNFRSGKIRNEIVCLSNVFKCAIANRASRSGVSLSAPSQSDQFGLPAHTALITLSPIAQSVYPPFSNGRTSASIIRPLSVEPPRPDFLLR